MLWRRLAIMVLLGWPALCCAQNYTCQADVFMLQAYHRRPLIWSPDRSKHILLWTSSNDPEKEDGPGYASVYSGKERLKTLALKDLSGATFVKWAPDSQAFYIMWSDGGSIGGYHARAFYWNGDNLLESQAPRVVARDFAQRHYCTTRGNNLFVIKWVAESKELLLQPQVYPTSDCQELGFTSGYLVDVQTAGIKKRYTAPELKKLTNGCPSKIFPSALASQEDVDKALRTQ